MPSVALATCVELPEPDPDAKPLLEALRDAGLRADTLAWDDPDANPADYELCVLRSCWNYHEDPRGFLDWLQRTAEVSQLWNPPTVIRQNIHKSYLRDLEQAGLAIVPTLWFDRGQTPALAALLRQRSWSDLVIKPSVSAASFRTRRFGADERADASAFLRQLLSEGDAMVQPFFPSFERPGEAAVVWIDGEPTHTVIKSPRFDGEEEQVSEARAVSPPERELAQHALRGLEEQLLYARVDMVEDARGQLCISELELIEPSLFLVQHPPALNRLVEAIVRRATSTLAG